jgi:hypothetical protein
MQSKLAKLVVEYRLRFGSAAIDARRLLKEISAVRERELDHPGVLADKEAAVRRRDAAKMRGAFEGYSVMIPEGRHRRSAWARSTTSTLRGSADTVWGSPS